MRSNGRFTGGSPSDAREVLHHACAVCREFTEVSRRGVLTCSPRCRAVLKRHPEIVKKLREGCELAADLTRFTLLQAEALNALTDCAGVRLPEDLWDRFWTGDIQPHVWRLSFFFTPRNCTGQSSPKLAQRAILDQFAVAVKNMDCAHPLTTGTISRKSPILTTEEINLVGVLGNRKSRVTART